MEINKRKNSIINRRSGFTLLEVLITVVIVGVLSLSLSSMLISLFRSASKTETVKEVKQNGEYALSVMQLKIRNALDVTSDCSSFGPVNHNITILNQDDTTSNFLCLDNRIKESIAPVSDPSNIESYYLTNTSVSVSASCNSLEFTCTVSASDGKSKLVKIEFTLTQSAVSPIAAERAKESFSAQVNLRNK